MASTPPLSIRIAANLDDLKASLATGSTLIGEVTAGMQKLSTSLDGSRLIQQATNIAGAIQQSGGAMNLTAAEATRLGATLDAAALKLQAMGQSLPGLDELRAQLKDVADTSDGVFSSFQNVAAQLGLVVSVGAAFEGLKSVGQFAKSIEDLSTATGIGVESLQELKYAADQEGVPLDELAQTIDRMQKNLTVATPAVAAAVADLGLSLKTLQTESPEQALLDISDALSKIPNHAQAVSDAMTILGRVSPQVVALMLSNIQGLESGAATMSAGQVKDLADAGNAWTAFGDNLEIYSGKILTAYANIGKGFSLSGLAIAAAGPLGSLVSLFHDGSAAPAPAPGVAATPPVPPDFVAQLAAAKTAMQGLSDATVNQIEAALKLGASTKDIESTYGLLPGELDLIKADLADLGKYQTAAAEAAKQHQQALDDVAASSQSVSASVAATIDQLHAQGVSESTIANALGLHEVQVRNVIAASDDYVKAEKDVADGLTKWQALETSLANEESKQLGESMKANTDYWAKQVDEAQKSAKAMADAFVSGQKSIEKAQDDYQLLIDATTKSTYDTQIDAITKWADAQKLAFKGTAAQAQEFGGVIDSEVKAKIQALGPAWLVDAGQIESSIAPMLTQFGSVGSAIDSLAKTAISDFSQISKGINNIGNVGESLTANIAGIASVAGGVIGAVFSIESAIVSAFGPNVQDLIASFGVTVASSLNPKVLRDEAQELSQLQGKSALTASTIDDLFKGISAGGDQATKATSTLTGFITQFQNQASQTSGIWSSQMHLIVTEAEKTGQSIDAITAALQTQAGNATTGLNQSFGVYTTATTAAASDQSTLTTSTDPATLQKATADLATQDAIIKATQVSTQQAASGLAAAAVQTVDANMRAGMSFEVAAKAAMPAIQGLQQELTASGFSGSAAFTLLSNEANLLNDAVAGPLITSVEGFTSAMTSLANTGDLTQDSFTGLESSIGSTYATLVAQGQSSQAVLAAMQPDLQAAWQAEQQFGDKADDATQALIDQGVQSGLVGEKQKSSTDQMLDALNDMVTSLHQVVAAMTGPNGMTSAAATAAESMNRSFSTVTGPVFSSSTPTIAPDASYMAANDSSAGGPGVQAATTLPADITIADIPLSTVSKSGLIWVRAGYDYVGGSPNGAAGTIGGASTSTAPLAGSSGGGQMAAAITNYFTITEANDPKATAAAVVEAIASSGRLSTRLTNGGAGGGVRSVLKSQGLIS